MHKPKIQIGREDMSRSAHTFLPKNKLVAGMGIGAIAMLAMAVPALTPTQEAPKKDEVFTAHDRNRKYRQHWQHGRHVLFV